VFPLFSLLKEFGRTTMIRSRNIFRLSIRSFARKAKVPKDPNKPSKCLTSGYAHFASETIPKMVGSSQTEKFTKMAEQWRGLTEEQKIPFEEKAALQKEQYKQALVAYDPEIWVKKCDENPKPPVSGYTQFVRDIYADVKAEFPDAHNRDIIKECSKKWNEVDATRKEIMNEEAKTKYFAWKQHMGL